MSISDSASGFLFVNKPRGLTSAQALNGIKAQFKKGHPFTEDFVGTIDAVPSEKIKNKNRLKLGHTGTLDAFASGLLICPYGKATVFAEAILKLNKTYLAEFYFGKATDTLDPVGAATNLQRTSWQRLWPGGWPDAQTLAGGWSAQKAALNPEFAWPPVADGQQAQIPPDFSAKKVAGKRASDRVRAGEKVALKPKDVEIHSRFLGFVSARRLQVAFQVSSGTYIRAIARDWGEALGQPAHVSTLHRPGIGLGLEPPEVWDENIKLAGHKLQPGSYFAWPGYGYLKTVLPSFELENEEPESFSGLHHGKKVKIGQTESCFTFHREGTPNKLQLVYSDTPESALLWTKQGRLALWMDNIQWQEHQITNYRIKKNFLAV